MEKRELQTDTDTTDNNIPATVREDSLSVEGLGCGVSVKGGRRKRQEWAFTLYDLDGQGRVTKEELAQLLKSLYDAVGSSMNISHAGGTKSLKLHVTVSPDCAKSRNMHTISKTDSNRDLNCKECNHDKEKAHSPKKDINSKLNNEASSSQLPHQETITTDELPSLVTKFELQNNLSKVQKSSHMHSSSKRLSMIEQRQLAELMQFNMSQIQGKKSRATEHPNTEQLCPKQSKLHLSHELENPDRRHYYLDLAGIENPSSVATKASVEPDSNLTPQSKEIPEVKPSSNSKPAALPVTLSAAEASGNRKKVRTKSKNSSPRKTTEKTNSDMPKEHVKGQEGTHQKQEHKLCDKSKLTVEEPAIVSAARTKSPEKPRMTVLTLPRTRKSAFSPHRYYCSKSSPKKGPTGVMSCSRSGHVTKSGHQKVESEPNIQTDKQATSSKVQNNDVTHRHKRHLKEKNHIRAMLQVAEWIEKEHTHDGPQGEHVTVEKHEHHHFHEHHHYHHYYHYQQT